MNISNNNSAIATTEQLKDYFLEPRRPGEKVWITSRSVAELFDMQHKHLLEAFKNLQCSREFRGSNFRLSNYLTKQGKEQPEIQMTRDGFVFLSMGFNSAKAAQFKEMIIARFNVLENYYFEREGYTAAANRRLVHKTVAEMKYAGYDYNRIKKELAPTQAQQREERMESLCETFEIERGSAWKT
jgi:Rha family phage regulatory protein